MTKIVLSTGNIVSGGPSIIRKPGAYRSNLELTNSLRSNFLAAQQASAAEIEAAAGTGHDDDTLAPSTVDAGIGAGNGHAAKPAVTTTGNGHAVNGSATAAPGNGHATPQTAHTVCSTDSRRPPLAAWTEREDGVLYIPRVHWPAPRVGNGVNNYDDDDDHYSGLQEEASQYEITVKLFFLPNAPVAERAKYAQEALALVVRELGGDPSAAPKASSSTVSSVDLLVVSFPGMSFDGDCEWEADKINASQGNDDEEVATWHATAEALLAEGRVHRLGVAEFGSSKLSRFIERVTVPPAVDQINVRNCCSVPPPLTALAKEKNIELFTHTDCTDILPPGTLRELLGQGLQGAGVLVEEGKGADALAGDLTPQWVVKYTAIVRDRGVIENKGYFAGAELHDR